MKKVSLILMTVLVLSCFAMKTKMADRGTYYLHKDTPVAVTEEDIQQATYMMSNGDKVGFSEMVAEGKVIVLKKKTEVGLLKINYYHSKVKIRETGKTVWVVSNNLKDY